MIALIPDPVILTHNGGTSMIGLMFGFLALTLFALFIVGVVLIGRKFAQLLHVRGDTEVLKAKIVQQKLKHNLALETHQSQLQMLALTAPTETAEEVKVKGKDVVNPREPLSEQWDHEAMQRNAVDAEVTPLPTID